MSPSEVKTRLELVRLNGECEWLQNRVADGRNAIKRLIICLIVVSFALVAMILWRALGGCP